MKNLKKTDEVVNLNAQDIQKINFLESLQDALLGKKFPMHMITLRMVVEVVGNRIYMVRV